MKIQWLGEGLSAVPGVKVGQVSDPGNRTGVTAVLFDEGAVGGCDVRGGAASTRQFGSLDALHVHGRVHGVVFAGGSAFGLEAGTGAARFLEEHGVGLPVLPGLKVPVVPTAIILDLGAILGKDGARPDAAMGYAACEDASNRRVEEGCVGAGTGAVVGKCMGISRAMKGGVGSAAARLPGGGTVGALVVVNAFGDIVDPAGGDRIAGVRRGPDTRALSSSLDEIVDRGRLRLYGEPLEQEPESAAPTESTTLALVATEIPLTRVELTHVARLAGHGLVRTISPCHTILDGDLVVSVGTSGREVICEERLAGAAGSSARVDASTVGLVAAEVLGRAVLRGVRLARGLPGLPGLLELDPGKQRAAGEV